MLASLKGAPRGGVRRYVFWLNTRIFSVGVIISNKASGERGGG